MRRTFVCLGDAVNLAARLMSKAPTSGVYVSQPVREAAGEAFIWHQLEDLTVKGKAAPIVAFSLTGSLERASRRRLRFELPLAGRLDELTLLEDRLAQAVAGERRIVGIAAEAGMGKSRLVAEFVRSARRAERNVVFGECQSFGTTTPYFVWREYWRRLLDVDEQHSVTRQRNALGRRIARIDEALTPRVPLLGPVLGLDIPDSELTASFDAKLRKASLEDLLSRCFRARASDKPLVVVLEDAHWIDELSRDLLDALVRGSADLPVLFVLAYRPASTPGGDLGVERFAGFDELSLAELSAADAAQIVRTKVEQLVGPGVEPPAALVERIAERSEGNPLYVEELVGYLAAQGADLGDEGAVAAIDLPESLHSLVLSRIDTVPEEPRRTLKVASVIGRVFRAPVLPEVYPDLGSLDDVRGHLGSLRGADLVRLDREAEEAYLFKHIVTQEVAYESMPFAVRASLHRLVGDHLERSAGETLDQQLDLLAHHYWHSDDEAKKVTYLGRAADAAQEAYANTAAVDYLMRLSPLVGGVARVEVLLKLARILTLVGDLGRAGEIGREARAAAEAEGDVSSMGWTEVALGEIARRQGRFDEAVERLRAAERDFTAIGDQAGVGRALHLLGTVSSQRGAHDDAERIYRESAAIRERIGDRASLAAIWTNLGIVADQRGDFAASRSFNEQALAIHRELGNRWGIANALNNIAVVDFQEGRLDAARDLGTEAVRGLAEIGDAQMLAIARHSLANVYRALGQGDEARPLFAASLETYRRLDDRWGLAFLLEDIGILVAAARRSARRAGAPGRGRSHPHRRRAAAGAGARSGTAEGVGARPSGPRGRRRSGAAARRTLVTRRGSGPGGAAAHRALICNVPVRPVAPARTGRASGHRTNAIVLWYCVGSGGAAAWRGAGGSMRARGPVRHACPSVVPAVHRPSDTVTTRQTSSPAIAGGPRCVLADPVAGLLDPGAGACRDVHRHELREQRCWFVSGCRRAGKRESGRGRHHLRGFGDRLGGPGCGRRHHRYRDDRCDRHRLGVVTRFHPGRCWRRRDHHAADARGRIGGQRHQGSRFRPRRDRDPAG